MDKSDRTVFKVSVGIAALFVLIGVLIPNQLGQAMVVAQTFVLESFGWFYQLVATFFLVFAIYMIFSKFGKIKLGKEDAKPEFSRPTWFAMLFSAGMGIGLLFYGVAEPIAHFASPPMGEGSTEQSAIMGMRYTWLHWGLHAWAIYAIVALALAYQKFRKDAPGLMSATLYPVLGEKVKGPIGKTVDVVAVFATLFGVAASLGLGSQQINAGLEYLIGIPNNFMVQMLIMGIITVLFIISANTGISRGIKYLSNINMSLATLLLFAMLILGPTLFLLNMFTTSLGSYVQNVALMGLRLSPFDGNEAAFTQGWTVFYWAWWISWTPFVGMFIARVSKGRTIREFTIAVLLVPTVVCGLWFTVFGGTGIYLELIQGLNVSGQGLETALFYVYQHLPFGIVLSILTVALITTFFVTSADSATFVLGMLTTGGKLNPNNRVKVTWGIILVASTLVLMASGGLAGLQTAIIVSALPLTFIVLIMCYGLVKGLNKDLKEQNKAKDITAVNKKEKKIVGKTAI
ncbi:glycine/betaine ABC transporter permease [Anaerobacillus alkalilacustris]|uniref:Glycine/betaine ABC transporter permease n=1 Tax=Anaerobacillus alkalilacustris TaxID=393763 RepID=A0A1S2LP99_9BACI|nr:BCCT family transporter [Anaerobacillus alkalilacustris]OIJ13943.1 glycine/betaine ABC transporter permease [Anaerobacillus alkalilacustris]